MKPAAKTKEPPKAPRQATPVNAGTTFAAGKGSEAGASTKPPQRRGTRHSHKPAATNDDRTAALAVLASVGVSLDSPNVTLLAGIYRDIVSELKAQETRQRECRAMIRALEGVKIADGPLPRSSDERERKRIEEIREGFLGILRNELPPTSRDERPPRGRPVNEAIGFMIGADRSDCNLGWKVCAGIAFLLSDDWKQKHGYDFAKRAFRDWDRRNKARA